jgi:hypothetical protein
VTSAVGVLFWEGSESLGMNWRRESSEMCDGAEMKAHTRCRWGFLGVVKRGRLIEA